MQELLFYLKLGWEHIVSTDALDHQLFILALVAAYTLKDLKKLLILVTAFTIGHSATLALSVFDVLRIPSDWVEFLIPCTIAITALFNLLKKDTLNHLSVNYSVALLFGFIHGMGFANSVRIMLAEDQSMAVGLLGFNIGLELGQIVLVAIILFITEILTHFLNVPKRFLVLGLSFLALLFALKMAFERIPF